MAALTNYGKPRLNFRAQNRSSTYSKIHEVTEKDDTCQLVSRAADVT